MKKNMKQSFGLMMKILPALLAAALLAGCADVVSPPRGGPGVGQVRISADLGAADTARTVYPAVPSANFAYAFATSPGGAAVTNYTQAGTTFTLPTGTYTVTVTAYNDADHTETVGTGTSAAFTVANSATVENVTVALAPVLTGQGTFTYSISYPTAAILDSFTLGTSPVTDLETGVTTDSTSVPGTTTLSGSVTVDAGSYVLQAALHDADGKQAGTPDAVHIYAGLTTSASYTFAAANFTTDFGAIGATVNVWTNPADNTFTVVGVGTDETSVTLRLRPVPETAVIGVNGGPYDAYRWSINGVAVTGDAGTAATYTFESSGRGEGIYRVGVEARSSTAGWQSAVIPVEVAPALISSVSVSGIAAPVTDDIAAVLDDLSVPAGADYMVSAFEWSPAIEADLRGDFVFTYQTVYTATITLLAGGLYTFTGDTTLPTTISGVTPANITFDRSGGGNQITFDLTFAATILFEGAGTAADPYLIAKPTELARLATLVNAGNAAYNGSNIYYRQTEDFSLAGYAPSANAALSATVYVNGWIPIGGATGSVYFNGTFDGNGYTITGLEITKPSTFVNGVPYGLFGRNQGTIKNVTLSGSVSGYRDVGGIAGGNTTTGTITNCSYSGSVHGAMELVGGLAGTNWGAITASTNNATVTGDNFFVGGVAGMNYGAITACRNTGDVTGSIGNGYNSVGGVAGMNRDANAAITACYNTGDVTGDSTGGVVGWNRNTAAITACYNTGAVTGDSTGGVAGVNTEDGAITACYYRDGGAGAGGTEFGAFGGSDWPASTDTGWGTTNWKNLNGSPTGHPQLWWE